MNKEQDLVLAGTLLCNAGEAQTPSANPLYDGTRFTYNIMKGYLTRTAAKCAKSSNFLRPTPAVRSFR